MAKTSALRKPQETPEHERVHPSDRAIVTANDRAAAAARSTTTVLVGCKLPNGLVLEIGGPGMVLDAQGRPVIGRRPAQGGQKVILKGANSLRTDRRAAQGVHPIAFTTVDKAFWDAWYEQHKDFDFIRRGLVFSLERASSGAAAADAAAIAKERIGERTGLEALAAEKDPRLPLGRTPMTTAEIDPASRIEGRERGEAVPV